MRIQKLIWLMIGISIAPMTQAQYYYSDLIGIRQVEQKQQLYKQLQVRQIRGKAILPNGEVQADFTENIAVSRQADTLQQVQVQSGVPTETTLFFSQTGQLAEQLETRDSFYSRIKYSRNANGQLIRIENRSVDSLSEFHQQEIHQWEYDLRGWPTKMWRILEKNEGSLDTTEIRFTADSTGLIIEERSFKKGRETGFYYYYYNDQRQITDIVRFNDKFKRLLPDQLFEYDESNNLVQRMQLTGSRDMTYLIFRYGYQANGLLTEEAMFNNKKEHTGSIRYQYTFR